MKVYFTFVCTVDYSSIFAYSMKCQFYVMIHAKNKRIIAIKNRLKEFKHLK